MAQSTHASRTISQGSLRSARPKEKTHKDLTTKSNLERSKLQQKVTKQLRDDIQRLYKEMILPDMVIQVAGFSKKFEAHSIILGTRFPSFYQFLTEKSKVTADSSSACTVFTIECADASLVDSVIRDIYSTDNLDEVEKLFMKLKQQTFTSAQDSKVDVQVDVYPDDSEANDTKPLRKESDLTQQVDNIQKIELNNNTEVSAESRDQCVHGTVNAHTVKSTANAREVNNLGQDMLHLFESGLNSDVVLKVDDKEFKCHKCLLSVRCAYFDAMFNGGWREGALQQVVLERLNPTAVYQSLLYLYGGVIDLDFSTCGVVDLVMVADMLDIKGLREVVAFHILKEFCHFFHKPCSDCCVGILNALPVAYTFELQDIFTRGLAQVSAYFGRFWQLKEFTQLPEDIMAKCCNAKIQELNPHYPKTVLPTLHECYRLDKSLPHVRRTEPVRTLVQQVKDAAIQVLGQGLHKVMGTVVSPEQGSEWDCTLLEDMILSAYKFVPVENICETYLEILKMKTVIKHVAEDKGTMFKYSEAATSMVDNLFSKFEKHAALNIHKVMNTWGWSKLDEGQKDRIKNAGCYVIVKGETFDRPVAMPKLTSMNKQKLQKRSSKQYRSMSAKTKKTQPAVPKQGKSLLTQEQSKAASDISLSNGQGCFPTFSDSPIIVKNEYQCNGDCETDAAVVEGIQFSKEEFVPELHVTFQFSNH